jgi:hypothetical protein
MSGILLSPEEMDRRLDHIREGIRLSKKWADIGQGIGLTGSAAVRFWHRYGAEKKVLDRRICMCCRKEFESEGKHNRLCIRCKAERSPSPWEVVVGTSRQVMKG